MAIHHSSVISHLKDMFNGNFDEDLIESVLLQRDWNVDRALDDLMALTTGGTFSIPIENSDSKNVFSYEKPNVSNTGFVQGNYINGEQNKDALYYHDGERDENENESEDDIIVLNEEEYCLPVESESEEENTEGENNLPNLRMQQTENTSCDKVSYAAVAKEKPPPIENTVPLKLPPLLYSGYTSYDRIKKTRDSLERVKLYAQGGFKIMVILRGCPGSGKSYLAASILGKCGITDNFYYYVHSTDNYFCLNKSGVFQFNPEKLPEAHKWNTVNVLHLVREGLTPIVVDNTNTRMWEMRDYASIAVCAGYEIEVMEPDTFWAFNASQLVKKNKHGVPKQIILTMLERYEFNITAPSLLKNFNLDYTTGNAPPQLGVRELKNVELKAVFDNIRDTIHAFPVQAVPKSKSSKKKQSKQLTKAERRKARKLEKKLKKAEINQENVDDESEYNEQENKKSENEEHDLMFKKSTENSESENTLMNSVMNNILESFISTRSEEDVDSDSSWLTVDNSDDNSNLKRSSSRDEGKSSSDEDENEIPEYGDEDTSSTSSNELSNNPSTEKIDEQQLHENDEITASVCPTNEQTEDLMKFSDDENIKIDEEQQANSVDLATEGSSHNVNMMVRRLKSPIDLDANDTSVEFQESQKFKFSNQLYDALAKSGRRLKCFAKLRNENGEEIENTNDDNFKCEFPDSVDIGKIEESDMLNTKCDENYLFPEDVPQNLKNKNCSLRIDVEKIVKNVLDTSDVESDEIVHNENEIKHLTDNDIKKYHSQNELSIELSILPPENEEKEDGIDFTKSLSNSKSALNLDQGKLPKYLWNSTKNSLMEDSKAFLKDTSSREFAEMQKINPALSPNNINSEIMQKPKDVDYCNVVNTSEMKSEDFNTDVSDAGSSCLLNDLIRSEKLQFSGNNVEDVSAEEQNVNISISIPISNKSPDKDLRVNCENIFKLDSNKTFCPIQSKRNKLCNVENQRCSEADLLQTFLNQDIYKNNRNENDVNVDDVLNSDKFHRGTTNTDISNSLIKNVIGNKTWGENFEDDVNVFESKNQQRKNNHSRLLDLNSANQLEENSENSDYGSHSSSSEEQQIEDIHNSVNRFVNNDINGDQAERKKANINRQKGMKNRYLSDDSSNENLCWSMESTMPELNTLKERILINSLDKVFNQSNKNSDQDIATDLDVTDTRDFNQFNLLNGRTSSSIFQMIENRLRDKNNVERINAERSDFKQDDYMDVSAKSETNDDVAADKADSKFWNQWMCGDSWEEDKSKETDAVSKDKIEVKPQRCLKDSPSKQKNIETASIRLVNDIRNSSDNSKIMSSHDKNTKNIDNVQRLPKSSNCQLTSELKQQYIRENKDNKDDHLTSGWSGKHINDCSAYPSDAVLKKSFLEGEAEGKCKFSDSTDSNSSVWSTKQVNRISYPSNSVLKKSSFEGETEIKRSSSELNDNADSAWSAKWPNFSSSHSSNGVFKKSSYDGEKPKLLDPFVESDDFRSLKISKNPGLEIPSDWNSLQSVNLDHYWKKNSDDNAIEVVEDVLRTLHRLKSTSPVNENSGLNLHPEDSKLKKSIHFDDNNFFIPAEILNLGRNKATNTGIDDLTAHTTYMVGHCREINERREHEDASVIELRYKSDKSTMTESHRYTVKAKPLREDLSNMFPPDIAGMILDLYEKCQGNMDWIIEILMEDGYSPSDDQLEYLSSLQNVADCNVPKISGTENVKMLRKKKCRTNSKTRRKNERINPTFTVKTLVKSCGEDANKEDKKNQPIETDVCTENVFDNSEESVQLFIDRETISQLEKRFGNPTVYPIKDYQPVIKLPVSLAQQIHAYLIESVIDQAEKNEFLINQLNEEEEILMNIEQNQNISQEFTPKDVIDVENSLSDILSVPLCISTKFETVDGSEQCVHELVKPTRSEDSFASKLSLNLLLKGFPTVDPGFIKNAFKSQNFSYYDTKRSLSQYGKEVPIGPTEGNSNTGNELLEDDDLELFNEFPRLAMPRNEAIEQVKHFRNEASFNYRQWQKCNEKWKIAFQQKKFGVAAYYREIMNAFKRKYEQCNAQASAILVTASCFQNENIIDLHFFKVLEALRALNLFLDHHLITLKNSGRPKMTVYIITGRGTRSIDGVSHLQPPIIDLLKRRNINFVIESRNTGLVKAVISKTSFLSCNRRY